VRAYLRPAFVLLLVLTGLTGVAYPLAMTGIASLLFPRQASGTLIIDASGRIRGSALIAQAFPDPGYFRSRASAAAADASLSSGTNLGPTNPALAESLTVRAARVRAERLASAGSPVPADLLTASASGLDPHLSPAGARWQSERVARARGITPARVDSLIIARTEPRLWGLFGEPRVNVLALNLALDSLATAAPATH
jgi:K+-transporting ATPase ATPase C chain